eukprot:jgi/Phyca11/532660/estExt2_fgenesh1_pg.C_PHYCAscaffold_70065
METRVDLPEFVQGAERAAHTVLQRLYTQDKEETKLFLEQLATPESVEMLLHKPSAPVEGESKKERAVLEQLNVNSAALAAVEYTRERVEDDVKGEWLALRVQYDITEHLLVSPEGGEGIEDRRAINTKFAWTFEADKRKSAVAILMEMADLPLAPYDDGSSTESEYYYDPAEEGGGAPFVSWDHENRAQETPHNQESTVIKLEPIDNEQFQDATEEISPPEGSEWSHGAVATVYANAVEQALAMARDLKDTQREPSTDDTMNGNTSPRAPKSSLEEGEEVESNTKPKQIPSTTKIEIEIAESTSVVFKCEEADVDEAAAKGFWTVQDKSFYERRRQNIAEDRAKLMMENLELFEQVYNSTSVTSADLQRYQADRSFAKRVSKFKRKQESLQEQSNLFLSTEKQDELRRQLASEREALIAENSVMYHKVMKDSMQPLAQYNGRPPSSHGGSDDTKSFHRV